MKDGKARDANNYLLIKKPFTDAGKGEHTNAVTAVSKIIIDIERKVIFLQTISYHDTDTFESNEQPILNSTRDWQIAQKPEQFDEFILTHQQVANGLMQAAVTELLKRPEFENATL